MHYASSLSNRPQLQAPCWTASLLFTIYLNISLLWQATKFSIIYPCIMALRGFKEKHYVFSCVFQTEEAHSVQVKAKFPLSMPQRRAYRRKKGIAPLILNSSARWGWVVTFTLWPLNQWETVPVPTEWEGGWAQSQSKHFEDDKNLLPLMEFEPWTVQPVL